MSTRKGDKRDLGYSVRARRALRLVEADSPTGELRQDEVAKLVSTAAGETIDQSMVSRWLSGAWPQKQHQRVAWAQVLRADPGWLYFGPDHSAAPPPVGLAATPPADPADTASTAARGSKVVPQSMIHSKTSPPKRGAEKPEQRRA